ncbi:hypothetical protein [Pseudarthrobacter sp. S9]|uniref:hypothetical protein n=1 Tax=Pseudarthrobacter sp. S9 TaxID=3418421 RepID=UPI003D00F296
MGARELGGIAGQLYALPYGDFVAARTAAAKEVTAAGPAAEEQRSLAAEVRSLPKPSVAAWAVNMLAAHHPETLRDLAELGKSMRAAQSALDAAGLRSLGQERRQLLSGAVRTARAVAEQRGRKISDAVATEVEQTLRAATADEGAAAAVQSGRLLRALSADGVDVVELAGAVAVPGSGAGSETASGPGPVPGVAGAPGRRPAEQPLLRAVRKEPRAPAPSAVERARAGLQAAEQAARAAAEEALRCEEELAAATAEATRLADEERRIRERLRRTEEELKGARKRRDLAAATGQQAARAADKERRKEVLARERLLRLGNTPES